MRLKHNLSILVALFLLQSCQTGGSAKPSTPKKTVDPAIVKEVENKPTDCVELGLIEFKRFITDTSNKSDEFRKKLHEKMSKEVAKKGGNMYRIKNSLEGYYGTYYSNHVEAYAYDCSSKK